MAKRQSIPKEEYLKGLNDVVENIQQAVDKIEHGSVTGLVDALLFVAEESQQRAPVDTGDLRGSVEVKIDDTVIGTGVSGGGIAVNGQVPSKASAGEVSYNTKYAANQHEHIEYEHQRGGQAKYLESVLLEHKDRILRLIADGIVGNME